ncbi:MAG: histidinol-phosphatase HisJ family protein, partial [Eubacterium sp.]
EKGAKYLAITDHCDIDGIDLDVEGLCFKQFNEALKMQEKYNGKINVLKGLEIGQGIYRKELTEKILSQYNYDFILGSLHNLENMEDFYFLDYGQFDVYELLTRYFEGLLELSQWGAFDSLAHLTYPLRYIIAREKIDVDMLRYKEIIDSIFENLAKNKKALEINTSGLFMEMKDTLPNSSFVKRFKEIGGEYITVGSDSHFAEKVCQGINEGLEIAYNSGFRYVTIYEKRQPKLIPIE